MCSGRVASEEETELKNHLKWATIKIGGDSWNCLSNVSIERDGYKYHFFPILDEQKARLKNMSLAMQGTKEPVGSKASLNPKAKELSNVEKEYNYKQIKTASMTKHVETVVHNLG